MTLDFSGFLLNYMERLFLKRYDIVNLLISIVAVIISLISLSVASNAIVIPDYKIILNLFIPIIILGIFIYVLIYVPNTRKKNNNVILEIEKIIILNYDNINGMSDNKKREIFNKLEMVVKNGFNKYDVDELTKQLSIRYPV